MFHSHAAAVQIPGSSHRVQLQLAFGSLFVSCRASWWLSCCWWEWSSPEKHLNVSDSQPVCARLWAHCGFLSKTNIVVLLFFCGYRSDLYTREEGTNDLMNRLTNPAVFNQTPGHFCDDRTRYFLMRCSDETLRDVENTFFHYKRQKHDLFFG